MKPALLTLLLLPLLTAAQEPVYMEAATQPAVGLSYLRTQFTYRELGSAGGLPEADEWQIKTRYTYGLRYNVSLNADIAVSMLSPKTGNRDQLLENPRLFAKWRVMQHDLGPVNTVRGSLIGGAEIPAGNDPSASNSLDPFFGGAVTAILDRHGFNADAIYQVHTGGESDIDNEFMYDASWLYRLSPPQWEADSKAALYTVMELNGRRWDNGDHELLAAPGILYEARTWAAEIALHLPVMEEMNHRRPENFGITAGVRYLF